MKIAMELGPVVEETEPARPEPAPGDIEFTPAFVDTTIPGVAPDPLALLPWMDDAGGADETYKKPTESKRYARGTITSFPNADASEETSNASPVKSDADPSPVEKETEPTTTQQPQSETEPDKQTEPSTKTELDRTENESTPNTNQATTNQDQPAARNEIEPRSKEPTTEAKTTETKNSDVTEPTPAADTDAASTEQGTTDTPSQVVDVPTADLGAGTLGLQSWIANLDLDGDEDVLETPALDDVPLPPIAVPSLETMPEPRTPSTKNETKSPAQPLRSLQPPVRREPLPMKRPGPVIGKKDAELTPPQRKKADRKRSKTSSIQREATPTPETQTTRKPSRSVDQQGRRMQRAITKQLGDNETSIVPPQRFVENVADRESTKITEKPARVGNLVAEPVLDPVPDLKPSFTKLAKRSPLVDKTTNPVETSGTLEANNTDVQLTPPLVKSKPEEPVEQTLRDVVSSEENRMEDAVRAVTVAPEDQKQAIAEQQKQQVNNASTLGQQKLATQSQQTERNESQRRQRIGKKRNSAHRKAAQHANAKKQKLHQNRQDSLTTLKNKFAQVKQAQEARLTNLLASNKQRLQTEFAASQQKQLDALTTGRDQIVKAKANERKGLEAQITREKALEDQNYKNGCTKRLALSNQVKAEHARIKNEAVRNANDLCTKGCSDFFNTGERLANDAISTANSEANALLEQGKREAAAAAQRARGAVPADAAKSAGDKAASAASRSELAIWQKKANDRRQQGQVEAKAIRNDYKGKADKLRADTQLVIRGHEDSERHENELEDDRCKTDLDTLEQIRVAAHQNFEGTLTDFDVQCEKELSAYEDYVQTQTALIKQNTENEHRTAVEELERDHAAKIEGVKNDVDGKLAGFETKLNGATERDVATLAKELNQLQGSIDESVATITNASLSRSAAYSQAADQKAIDINTRAMSAVAAIENEARVIATSKIGVYKEHANNNRELVMSEAKRRAENSYVRQRAQGYNDNHTKLETVEPDRSTIDANIADNDGLIAAANQEEQRFRRPVLTGEGLDLSVDYSLRQQRDSELDQEKKDNYKLRRTLKTGQEQVTPENASEKRTEVLTAFEPTDFVAANNNADPGKGLAILATMTRDELMILYPPGSEARKQLLASALKVNLYDQIDAMLGDTGSNNSSNTHKTSDPRTVALEWALARGDKRVADAIFNSLTTDAERAQFDSLYQNRTGASIRDSFTNLSEQDRKEMNVSWDAGRTFFDGQYTRNDNTDLTTQWNQEKSRREAIQTVATYDTADKNKLLTLRSEMFKRHAGPYLDDADKQRHEAELQKELEQFDSTVFNVSGQSMETMDTQYTSGKTREALLATSHRVVIDPNEPDFTRPEGDWNKFGVALMQRSIEKNDYDTRLAENFLGKIPADKRKELLERYAEQTQSTYVDDVNKQVRTSQAQQQNDSGDVSWRKAKLGDPDDLGSTSQTERTVPASEIDADALISIANTGDVRDALRLLQLKNGRGRGDEADQAEFAKTLNQVTMKKDGFADVSNEYAELAKKYNLQTTGQGDADLIRDAQALLAPRQARKAVYEIETSGAERTPEWDKARRDRIWQDDSLLPKGMREALEGPAGREVYSAKQELDAQLEQMRRDGTANLTPEKMRELMLSSEPPPFTEEQLSRYAKYQTRSDATVASDETMKVSYENNVRNAAMFAATGVVVVGSIVLTGPLGPVIAGAISSAAGGLTTLGIKQIAYGSDYSSKEFKNDATSVIVDAVVNGVLAGGAINAFASRLVGKVGAPWARELLAEAIQNTATSVGGELTKALLDPDTYVGNPDQIRERLLARVKKSALTGAITGGTKGALSSKATTYMGLADSKELTKGTRAAIEMTSNVAGTTPTAKSAAEVLNAALMGLNAYTDLSAKSGEVDSSTTALTTTDKSKRTSTTETYEPNTRVVETQEAEVSTLRELNNQQAKIYPRNQVDESGRRVYDVVMPDGNKVVVKGPMTDVPAQNQTRPDTETPDRPETKNTSLMERPETALVPTTKSETLMERPETALVPMTKNESLMERPETALVPTTKNESLMERPETALVPTTKNESVMERPETALVPTTKNESLMERPTGNESSIDETVRRPQKVDTTGANNPYTYDDNTLLFDNPQAYRVLPDRHLGEGSMSDVWTHRDDFVVKIVTPMGRFGDLPPQTQAKMAATTARLTQDASKWIAEGGFGTDVIPRTRALAPVENARMPVQQVGRPVIVQERIKGATPLSSLPEGPEKAALVAQKDAMIQLVQERSGLPNLLDVDMNTSTTYMVDPNPTNFLVTEDGQLHWIDPFFPPSEKALKDQPDLVNGPELKRDDSMQR